MAGVESARKFLRLEIWGAAAGGFSRSPGYGSAHPDRREQARAAHGPADAPHRLMLGALRKRLPGMSGWTSEVGRGEPACPALRGELLTWLRVVLPCPPHIAFHGPQSLQAAAGGGRAVLLLCGTRAITL